mmetsp:Transcript_36237/g.115425  ORF Transcript_36237/g.115425 Transcript_36237/m.115425 type:complete len:250 (-) Transcript_36237:4-753(-)
MPHSTASGMCFGLRGRSFSKSSVPIKTTLRLCIACCGQPKKFVGTWPERNVFGMSTYVVTPDTRIETVKEISNAIQRTAAITVAAEPVGTAPNIRLAPSSEVPIKYTSCSVHDCTVNVEKMTHPRMVMVAGGVRESGLRRGVTSVGGARMRAMSACKMTKANTQRRARRTCGDSSALLRKTRSTLASARFSSPCTTRPTQTAIIAVVKPTIIGVGERVKPPSGIAGDMRRRRPSRRVVWCWVGALAMGA